MKRRPNGTEPLKGFEVEFEPGWRGWAKRRSDDELAEVRIRLEQIKRHFGSPHQHAGLGVRRLARHHFEFRISRGLRVIFVFHKPRTLTMAMIGNHDDVRAWIKSNL